MEYPCYKIHEHSGRILELTSSRKGTIVYDKTDYYKKGTFNDDWAERVCRPLTNEEYFDFVISPLTPGDEFAYEGKEYKINSITRINDLMSLCYGKKNRIIYFKRNEKSPQIFNIKKGKEKMTTEYKSIKEITGKEIVLNDACEYEAKKFIEHFGIKTVVQWSKDNEDYIVMQDGWIRWLLKKGFIEANKIEYDPNKLYFHKYSGDVYKLDNKSGSYSWFKFDTVANKLGYWDNTGNDSFEEAIKCIKTTKIESFDTFEEAIKFYFPDMNKSEELTDDMSKLKKMKEWMNKFDFSVDCHDFDGCNADVDCDDCPFQTK